MYEENFTVGPEWLCMNCWRDETGVKEDPATAEMLARMKRDTWPAGSPEERQEAAEMCRAQGWPASCPRCEGGLSWQGWDVRTNQCRECWEKDVQDAKQKEEAVQDELMAEASDPEEDWCMGVKVTGERCTKDAEKDGYCRLHWRQAQDRHARGKGFAPGESK